MREAIKFTSVIFLLITIVIGIIFYPKIGFSILALLIISLGLYDVFQKDHAVLRVYPVIGHMRYLLEMIGPEIRQYFVENDTDGKPINRNDRTYIYQRAKLARNTHPFGTELNVEESNYQWIQHSIYPAILPEKPPRVLIGGASCKHSYSASVFNISAMSYGSLSKNAITALNLGAKAGNFFHDTGEGGISPYHRNGGDLVWEIGTGYFGCRTEDGNFSPEKFKEKAGWEEVKMIEIKISQGAKPGHGGVLPGSKNTVEISKIRGVKPHIDIISPPGHSAFNDAKSLLEFVQELRLLSDGKPIGFKLCIGDSQEFVDICEQMVKTGILPDFITVDGAEGGTGAAPIDFSNHVGMPWEQALIFVVDSLNKFNLKEDIKLITATKIFSAFDIFKALCIGADVCNSARGMMLALGCIQSLKCDTNKCPTGVTSNNPAFYRGLVVEDKWKRVKNYQEQTVKEFCELMSASGCADLNALNRRLIYKKIDNVTKSYEQWYPSISPADQIKQEMTH